MSLVHTIGARAKSVALQVLAACLVVYFGYHLVQGERGLLAWWRLNDRLAESNATLTRLHLQRQSLQADVRLMQPEHIDEDMLDERVRAILGMIQRNEIVIFDRKAPEAR